MVSHPVANVRKWSCQNREIPAVSQIKSIHVYDFDNTLFKSPLPNVKLWTGPSVGFLQTMDCFANGGWWHDQHILEATGEGIEKEEPRGWEGWWNEQIAKLVEISMQQKGVLTVLLTGRGEHNFADLIKRMVASKKLEFDMICLKQQVGPKGQRFPSTMAYKQCLLEDLIYTYKDADEIKVYEDRIKHAKGFREFFEKVNKALLSFSTPISRKPITAEVTHVAELSASLDPVIETAEVQRMINSHNMSLRPSEPNAPIPNRLQIKKTVFFTGYLISPADSINLLSLVSLPTVNTDSELKLLANNILITPRPAHQSILDKVGGIGAKQIWQVNGIATLENKIWAARVAPMPPSATYYTDNAQPIIVLACRKGAKPADAGRIQNWQPVATDKQYVFETTVGEKVQLRIEKEVAGENEYESLFPSGKSQSYGKRKHMADDADHRNGSGHRNENHDDNRRSNFNQSGYRNGNGNRGKGGGGNAGSGGGHRNPGAGGRGSRGGNRGGGNNAAGSGGGGGGGRGRNRGGYKSLDDVGTNSRYGQGSGYQNHQPNYDDGASYNNAAGSGGDGYNAAFPPLGGGVGTGGRGGGNGGGNGCDDSGGLPYH